MFVKGDDQGSGSATYYDSLAAAVETERDFIQTQAFFWIDIHNCANEDYKTLKQGLVFFFRIPSLSSMYLSERLLDGC